MQAGSTENIYRFLDEVKDPEIPTLSIVELGIVRGMSLSADEITLTITPTYAGCPAMKMIEDDIRTCLTAHGFSKIKIQTVLAPAWTTDWLSESGKEKLRESGIAPPVAHTEDSLVFLPRKAAIVQCPFCGAANTKQTSAFGSTACKALYYCDGCTQPFEYFKSF